MLATGEFYTIEQAHELFVKEFLNHKDNHLLSERLYFVVNSEGKYIGTAILGQWNLMEKNKVLLIEYQ
ncbi:unnamed protein product [Adineta steineri]|uniref:Uncharacterized protein n=2 Tax=Adineta steineri TaxID=433720 RepID=A0A818PUR3_9BILA|nr:unnamed protein product [Adineta steineri]